MNAGQFAGTPSWERRVRVVIALSAVAGVASGITAIAVAVIVLGGVGAGLLAAILPTIGMIRAVNLTRTAPALAVIAVAAVVGASMLLTNPGAAQLGVLAFVFTPVVAGETVRYWRRRLEAASVGDEAIGRE